MENNNNWRKVNGDKRCDKLFEINISISINKMPSQCCRYTNCNCSLEIDKKMKNEARWHDDKKQSEVLGNHSKEDVGPSKLKSVCV